MAEDTRTYLISEDGGVVYFDNPQYVTLAVANGWHIVDRETYERIRNAHPKTGTLPCAPVS
jgi:hypothetical protein